MKRLLSLLFLLPMLAIAQVPGTISYQGILTDNLGNPVSDGNYSVVFTIWDANTAGNQEWTETQTVATDNGVFNVELGSVSAFSTGTVDFEDSIWLQLAVEGNTLTPRIKFLSSAFTQNAAMVNGGTIDGTVIGGTTPSTGSFTTAAIISGTMNNGTINTADINGGNIDATIIGAVVAAPATVTDLTVSGAISFIGQDVQDSDVADNLTISGGAVNNTVIGGTTPAAGTFTTGTIATADINGGAIDGTVIGGTTPSTGSFTTAAIISGTMNNGTINTADINGGNIDATIIGAVVAAPATVTDLTVSGAISFNGQDVQDSDVADNLTISGGAVNNTVIGGTTPAAATVTSLRVTAGATNGHVLTSDASGNGTWQAPSGGGGSIQAAVLLDQKTHNTDGGAVVAGAWTVKALNTEQFDPDNITTISSNEFTLGAGDYIISVRAVFADCDGVVLRVRNVTDNNTAILGISDANYLADLTIKSTLDGGISIGGTKDFRIEYYAETANVNSFAQGDANASSEPEVFMTVKIIKLD